MFTNSNIEYYAIFEHSHFIMRSEKTSGLFAEKLSEARKNFTQR